MRSISSVFVLSAIVLSLLVSSCEDKESIPTIPEPLIPSELVGTWLYQAATINGAEISIGFLLQWHEGVESAQFTVSADGTFLYEELDADTAVVWVENGTISIDGHNATIIVTSDSDGAVDPPDILSGTWHLEGDILALTTSYEGATVVMYAIKI
ncbi:MAG: hypothetical protein V3W18_12125 [candidate division Zixibacteria bacterium]